MKKTIKTDMATYTLEGNDLWTTGKFAFFCGTVSHPENMAIAIDNHEEEMRCRMADAKAEFGINTNHGA